MSVDFDFTPEVNQIDIEGNDQGGGYASLGRAADLGHRVSMAALPVMMYFDMTFYPAWIAMSAIETVDSAKGLYTVINAKWKGETVERDGKNVDVTAGMIAYQLFELAASVTVLALSIVLLPIGLLVSSVVGIGEDLINIAYYTVAKPDAEKLAVSCVKLMGHTATLAGILFAQTELLIIGGGIGVGVLLYKVHKEINTKIDDDPSRILETTSFVAQAILKTQGVMEKIAILAAERRK